MAHRRRVITTHQDLERESGGTVVIDHLQNVYQMNGDRRDAALWWTPGNEVEFYNHELALPVTVIWEPK